MRSRIPRLVFSKGSCALKEYSSNRSFLLTRCPRPLVDRDRTLAGKLGNDELEVISSGENELNGVSGTAEKSIPECVGEDDTGPSAGEGEYVYEENRTLVPRVYGDERGLALDNRLFGLFRGSTLRWRGECEDRVGEICTISV